MMSRSKKKGKAKYTEDDFEAFLEESISDDDASIDTARISEYLDPKKKKILTYDVSDDEDDDIGRIGTGTRFMKSTKVDPPKPAARKTSKENDLKRMGGETDLSRDSLDDVSFGNRNETRKPGLGIPALSLGSSYTDTPTESHNMNNDMGMDTLQEMKEKEDFFEDLQKRSGDETLDYNKLNRELDGSSTLAATALTKQETLDESGDYRERGVNHASYGGEENPDEGVGDKNPSMLAKVSLLDSLDSTLGTKQGSHDMKGDSAEMKPIEEEYDEMDGHTEQTTINRRASAIKAMDNLKVEPASQKESTDHTGTNKGMTLKTGTGTGFQYTDTSHEIQALQDAMRQIGTGTMDTKDFTFQDSSASAFGATGHTANTDDATGGFGMKPVAPPRTDKSRTVDDIIREVEDLRTNSDKEPRGFSLHRTPPVHKYGSDKDLETGSFNVNSAEMENRGFDLSPAATAFNNMTDQGDDISLVDKYPVQSSGSIDFHSSTTTAKKLYPPDEDLPHSVPDSVRKGKKIKNRYAHVKGSGYGRKHLPPHSPPKKSASKPSNNWSPADKFREKVKGTESLNRKTLKVSGSSIDDNLMQSVQSFANYIQQQFTVNSNYVKDHPEIKFSEESPKLSSRSEGQGLQSALIAEAQDWRNQWKEERKKFLKLQGELANQEREHHEKIEALRVQHEEEMFNVKQENFILSAKVAELEKQVDARKRIAAGGSLESASSEQAERLEKEIRDQEKLLAGYQSENERLYQDMKKIQGETKATQERMFRENERLKTEVRSLKENLERKEVQLKNKGLITGSSAQQEIAANSAVLGAGRIAQLEAELRQAKAKELSLQREVEVLSKAKEEVEKHVDELVRKIGEFEEKVKKAKSLQSQEVKDIEKKYEIDLEKLNRKLKWYAENQDLLDKDSEQLKKKDVEIKELRDKVEFLQTEHGRRQAEAKARMKERNTDSKKIQDLQRQVREMENILRKRNPNSLPVLMWAASSAPEPEGKKAPSVEHLENRIKKLESELDEKDEESKRSLRVVEQKYNAMKMQFEERQNELEERLLKYERPGDRNLKEGERPHTHVGALEKELESVKERYKKRLAEAENEADRLRREIATLRSKETAATRNESKISKETEVEVQVRLKTLQNDLADSRREKQFLQTTINRIQKEKQQLIIDATRKADKSTKVKGLHPSRGVKSKIDTRTKSKSAGNKKLTLRAESDSDSEQLPPMSMTEPNGIHNSVYQPQNFAQSHIDDILRENEDLKLKLERAEWEKDSHRVHLQKLQAEAEAKDRRLREDAEEQITTLRMTHQQEMQRLLSEHAMQHSMSRVADLQAKVDSQEVMIRHLRHQVAEGEVDQEKFSALKIRETTLETRVKELIEELQEAKKSQAPEMRHFDALQEKIKKLESRHVDREYELQTLLRQSHAAATAELQSEIAKWKRTVELKNREIEHFRLELDNILEVLKELRRQGVVLPGYGSQLSLASGRSAGSAYTSTPR